MQLLKLDKGNSIKQMRQKMHLFIYLLLKKILPEIFVWHKYEPGVIPFCSNNYK